MPRVVVVVKLALSSIVTAQGLRIEGSLVESLFLLRRHDNKAYTLELLFLVAAVSRCNCFLSSCLLDLEFWLVTAKHTALVLREEVAWWDWRPFPLHLRAASRR